MKQFHIDKPSQAEYISSRLITYICDVCNGAFPSKRDNSRFVWVEYSENITSLDSNYCAWVCSELCADTWVLQNI